MLINTVKTKMHSLFITFSIAVYISNTRICSTFNYLDKLVLFSFDHYTPQSVLLLSNASSLLIVNYYGYIKHIMNYM